MMGRRITARHSAWRGGECGAGGREAADEMAANGSNSPTSRSDCDCEMPRTRGEDRRGDGGQMGMIADWPSMAACRSGDPDALFVQGAEQNVAKRICRSCPVRYECLADALDNRIEFGVWGGMTERERRALLRRHPQVASWKKTFEAALLREGTKQSDLVPTG